MDRSRTTLASYALIAGLILALAFPTLGWLVRTWLTNPYYSHGFLILPIAVILAWRQWRWLKAEPRQGSERAGLAVTMASLLLVLWAMWWQNHVVASLSLVGVLIGVLLFLEGWARIRHWLFPLLFLVLMVPLPFVNRASPWFESFTARSATALAQLVGISAVQQGGQISLPGTTLIVGAPCSGLRSLVTMMTVGVLWVYLVKGRLAAKVALLLAVLPLMALSNVLRITLLLVVAHFLGQAAAMTYYHNWSSPVLFLLALGLFLLLGKVLGCSQLRGDIL